MIKIISPNIMAPKLCTCETDQPLLSVKKVFQVRETKFNFNEITVTQAQCLFVVLIQIFSHPLE
jgi:hypothetical protein